ncbi:MAG: hypothetical protein GC204_05390 [Chloroflexi bacterium]|nr:hypothetical protein [Chloroflexota bacterium]
MAEPNYTVWVKTGDEPLGGTDSNVYLMLFGSKGQTDWILLDGEDIFAFEEGAVDKFMLDIPDLGELARCCVGHDNSADPGWFVEDVRVRSASGKEWAFKFHQWLGEEEAGRLATCIDLS